MTRLIWKLTWEKIVVDYFKVSFQYLVRGTKKKHENFPEYTFPGTVSKR
jgi:hypothetical protein